MSTSLSFPHYGGKETSKSSETAQQRPFHKFSLFYSGSFMQIFFLFPRKERDSRRRRKKLFSGYFFIFRAGVVKTKSQLLRKKSILKERRPVSFSAIPSIHNFFAASQFVCFFSLTMCKKKTLVPPPLISVLR